MSLISHLFTFLFVVTHYQFEKKNAIWHLFLHWLYTPINFSFTLVVQCILAWRNYKNDDLFFETFKLDWFLFPNGISESYSAKSSQNVIKVKHGNEHMLWYQDLWSVASLEQCPCLISTDRSTSIYASRKCSLQTGRVAHIKAWLHDTNIHPFIRSARVRSGPIEITRAYGQRPSVC